MKPNGSKGGWPRAILLSAAWFTWLELRMPTVPLFTGYLPGSEYRSLHCLPGRRLPSAPLLTFGIVRPRCRPSKSPTARPVSERLQPLLRVGAAGKVPARAVPINKGPKPTALVSLCVLACVHACVRAFVFVCLRARLCVCVCVCERARACALVWRAWARTKGRLQASHPAAARCCGPAGPRVLRAGVVSHSNPSVKERLAGAENTVYPIEGLGRRRGMTDAASS